jgi:hypothetical protein
MHTSLFNTVSTQASSLCSIYYLRVFIMKTSTKLAVLLTALLANSAFAAGSQLPQTASPEFAREASEGPRGEGGKKGGHPAIETRDEYARHGADDTQPDDRGGHRGGRR